MQWENNSSIRKVEKKMMLTYGSELFVNNIRNFHTKEPGNFYNQ